jgi:uncharacterized protein
MYFDRRLEKRLRHLCGFFPAVAVSGARQTGKTTLLRHCFPEYHYVSLDLPSKAEQAERNPADFLAEHPDPVIIDEIQYAPGLLRHLKAAIDAKRHINGRYLLTGSQHFTLMRGVSESLAGRIGLLELETLSLAEIPVAIASQQDKSDLIRLMARGHFPELWRVPRFPANDFYAAYVATYLERDVRQILNVTSLRDFERFLRILAARSGNILNKSEVARDVGVSVKAIGDWISVLQTSGQIALLEPWFTNISKRVVKTPKIYFCDCGLLCFLLNLTEETLPSSRMLGAVWETLVFSELRKRSSFIDVPVDIWFYRDQRSREIDFILDRGSELSFIEAKWQEHPVDRDAKTIHIVSAELLQSNSPWKPGHHYVVGTPPNAYDISDGITAIGIANIDRTLSPVAEL